MAAAACGARKSCRSERSPRSFVCSSRAFPRSELGVRLTLVVSVLKGDKMDDVVRDAVMLGVTSIRPVVSERSEIGLAAMARSSRIARWQRIAVASAKQCGRAVVPPILDAVPLDSVLERKEPARRRA